MNLPNLLTLFRVTAVPVFVGLVLSERREAAFFLFLAAGITDALDGLLAKLLAQRTQFGSYMDPVADKFLVGLSFLILTAKGGIPLWLSVIVLGRDFVVVTGFILLRVTSFDPKVEPSRLGKAAVACQVLLVLSVLSRETLPFLWTLRSPLMGLVVIFTCASGVQYVLRGAKILEKGGQGCQR